MCLPFLSDEAREAQVTQAKAMLEQKRVELVAKRRLLLSNAVPKLELDSLEAQFKVAEAAVATAEAERDRGIITAPWDGIVTEVSEVGTAAFSFTGKEIIKMVGLDPVLALVEVSERKRRAGQGRRHGRGPLRQRPDPDRAHPLCLAVGERGTRTYRVEVQIDNPTT